MMTLTIQCINMEALSFTIRRSKLERTRIQREGLSHQHQDNLSVHQVDSAVLVGQQEPEHH
jgi:hypothetical protein